MPMNTTQLWRDVARNVILIIAGSEAQDSFITFLILSFIAIVIVAPNHANE